MKGEIWDREALETINANHSLSREMHHLRENDCKQETPKCLAYSCKPIGSLKCRCLILHGGMVSDLSPTSSMDGG